jgi:type VI secretion system protein ImpJ
MKAHDIPDAIQWHEGLLLTPQHFQQLSSRHEALVQYSTSVVAPFCWGIRRFRHNAISLTVGKLTVVELEAVMPDGLVISHAGDSSEGTDPLEVDLTRYAEQMADHAVTVYLAVPAKQSGNSNGDAQRYAPFKGGLVADEVAGGKPREIYRLRPRLSLLVTDSLPTKYIGFPVAKVALKDSSYVLDDEFVPPLLSVPVDSAASEAPTGAAQRLADMCSETAQRVRKRAMYLADEDRSDARDEPARSEAATRSLMLSLVGALPQLEAVLKIGAAHPFTVYLALCGMAGQLAVLATEMIPPSFDQYNHNDIYASFKSVLDFINRTLEQGVPLSYKSFPFRYYEGAFELHFDEAWMHKRLAIGMKGPRGLSDSEVVRWGENCLIGSQSKIESMREKRITGAGRKHVDRVGDIVPANRVALFSLNADASCIEPEELLQIVNRQGVRPNEIVLHVMDS